RRLGSAASRGDKQAMQLGGEIAGACAGSRRDSLHLPVMIRILLVENGNGAFPAYRVDALASGVVKSIIRITDHRQARDQLARRGIEDEEPSRMPTDDEQAVIRLIERHGIVRHGVIGRPRCGNGTSLSIDDGDLMQRRKVYEDSRSL